MAGIKISDLPAVVAPALSDVFPIDQGAVTYKQSASQLLTLFQSNIVITNSNLSGVISPDHGGTGINNGVNTLTLGGNASFVGAFTFAATLTGNTSVTFPTSGTLATTASLLTSPLTTKGDIWSWSTTNDRLPVGTINGQILQVNSVAATGLSYSTATYPSASGSAGKILRSDGTNNIYSQTTYPDIVAINSILFANISNNVAAITPAQGSVLVSDASSVPQFLANPAATGRMLRSVNAAIPAWSTATFPSTAGTSGNVLTSDGTNFVSSAPAASTGFESSMLLMGG